ncbi:hypothetical protein FQA39_LY12431 [Lamprigera yunnana]|nr:hypothetical protein FQA39_LY12431 [Lamprigera yunnana]
MRAEKADVEDNKENVCANKHKTNNGRREIRQECGNNKEIVSGGDIKEINSGQATDGKQTKELKGLTMIIGNKSKGHLKHAKQQGYKAYFRYNKMIVNGDVYGVEQLKNSENKESEKDEEEMYGERKAPRKYANFLDVNQDLVAGDDAMKSFLKTKVTGKESPDGLELCNSQWSPDNW